MSKKQKKLFRQYKVLRKDIKRNLSIRFLQINKGFICGTRCVIAVIEDMSFPVGTVWYQLGDGHTCSIMTSYVEPWARRLKVRTRLNKAIIEGYPDLKRITTGHAISKASAEFMKRQGYKKKDGIWVLKLHRDK